MITTTFSKYVYLKQLKIMYKITQKQDIYHVYKRFLLFFWIYQETFGCLYNAKKYIEFQETPEIETK